MAGDETVVTKAGKHTYGLERFFSSIHNRVVPGLSFFALSLINVRQGTSHPLLIEQIVREPNEKTPTKATKATKAAKAAKTPVRRGRPKGSKNKDKTHIEWTPELRRLQRMGNQLLQLIGTLFPVTYLVLDGHFANNNVLQVVRQQLQLHLISKLRTDSALFFPPPEHATMPPADKAAGRSPGAPRVYGARVDYQNLPPECCLSDTQDKDIRSQIYQANLVHGCFAQHLNVVILVKTHLKTGARAHVVLMSSDLSLEWELLVKYYRLRFQIEFNFRDAKQFWGLEDFMNTGQTPVTNAVHLAFFMVNVSKPLLGQLRQTHPLASILDLKARWRAKRYVHATLKCLTQKPEPFFIHAILHNVAQLGAIHPQKQTPLPV